MKNTFYNTCVDCGSNLDPGEKCNCQEHDAKTRMANVMFDLKENPTACECHFCGTRENLNILPLKTSKPHQICDKCAEKLINYFK